MPQVFLHIGRQKTGTTAIQKALSENRAALAELGVLYPGTRRHHHEIAFALSGAQNAGAAEAAQIRSEIVAAPGRVIVSSEGLQNVPPAAMRDWLGSAAVHVIVYLREQAEAFASHYQQHVKAELETTPFEQYVAPLSADYGPFLDSWANTFGRENMTVRAYDPQADALLDFLAIVDVAPAALRLSNVDPNPSIAGALLEAKRRCNGRFTGDLAELRAATYPTLLALANENPRYRGRVGAAPDVLARVRSKHAPQNMAMAQRYLARDVAFAERAWSAPTFTEDEVLAAWQTVRDRTPMFLPAID